MMTRRGSQRGFRRRLAPVALALVIGATLVGSADAAPGSRTVEASGIDLATLLSGGDHLRLVTVLVEVPDGTSAEDVTRAALWSAGAMPLEHTAEDDAAAAKEPPPAAAGAPVARFDPADPTFTATPWPSDRVVAADGRVDFTGTFPNPNDIPMLATYLSYGDGFVSGFGRNGAVYFGLSAPIDEATLPSAAAAMSDPAVGAQLLDLTAGSPDFGRQLPLEFRQRDGVGDPFYSGHTLVMRPVNGFPLADAHTYCAMLTNAVTDDAGNALTRDAAFGKALADDPSLAPLRSWLAGGAPIAAADVVVATCFTSQDASGELRRVEAFLETYPTTGLYDVVAGRSTDSFDEVLAAYRAPNFQAGEKPYFGTGGGIEFGPDGQPVVQLDEEIRVRFLIPRGQAMPASGWPVVLYSHGTGGDWSSCLEVAGGVTRQGLALLCIDQPLHGTRGDVDPFTVAFNFANPAAARTNLRQGALDVMWLTRMIAHGRFDLPANSTGLADAVALDAGGAMVFGHSQGGMTGGIALGVDPRISGGVLSAPTALLADSMLLQRSEPVSTRALLAEVLGIPEGQLDVFHPVITLLQTVYDAADPINYAPYWVEPVTGGHSKHAFMLAGSDDPFSPLGATSALAAATGVPLVEPVAQPSAAHDLRGLDPVTPPVSGNLVSSTGDRATAALRQVDGGGHMVAFVDAGVRGQWEGFLQSFAAGVQPVIAPAEALPPPDDPPPPPPDDPPPPPPANDLFADAFRVVGLPYEDVQITDGATSEAGEPGSCAPIGATVWYRFTPAGDVLLDLTTVGSSFDTVLAVYTGETLDALTPVGCNDDDQGLQSRVVFQAAAGTTYHIQAGGFRGDHGELILHGDELTGPPPPPDGDPPPPPDPDHTCILATDPFDPDPDAPCLRWPQFFDSNPATDFVELRYLDAAEPPGVDGLGALHAAQETWSRVGTSNIRFALAGQPRCPPVFRECREPIPHNGLNELGWAGLQFGAGALAIAGVTYHVATGFIVESDVWMNRRFQRWSTDGSGFDVESVILHELGHGIGLAHHPNPDSIMHASIAPGADRRALGAIDEASVTDLYPCPEQEACGTGALPPTKESGRFGPPPSRPGPGDRGRPPPPADRPPPPPANDLFADATVIGALPFSTTQTTTSATLEPGEVICGDAGATVWYRFTPAEDLVIELDTMGSNFDTVLAVFTGATVDALNPVACNDDARLTLQSRVVFEAAAATTYYIQLGGHAHQTGDLVVNANEFTGPPPESCEQGGGDFPSPGAFQFTGTVCPDSPFNIFLTELDGRGTVSATLTDPSSGDLRLVIHSCDLETSECVQRAAGTSNDGGARQAAGWDNCTGAGQLVIIEVALVAGDAAVTYDLHAVTEGGSAACG